MYNVLKSGAFLGVVIALAGCSASEHFMQDDVYNTRTPIMPPGTDLNDVTDYATFVAKKELSEKPERTAYVSPREYNDYFYYSQFMFYGYSPYAPITGLSYYGYGNYYHPMYGYGMNGMFFGNPYPYGYNNAYYGYHPYYWGVYGQSYYGNTSWYSPVSKPNTPKNLPYSSARVAGGRGSNLAPPGYTKSQIMTTNGTIRNNRAETNSSLRSVNTSPIVTNNGRSTTVNRSARPVVSNPSTGVRRPTGATQSRPAVNHERNTRISRPGGMNNTNNSTPTRTNVPTIRSGGSSGTPSSGGSRSGGRR